MAEGIGPHRESMSDTVQMKLIRRYARLLREQQAEFRGPRIGARERRAARKGAEAPRDIAHPAVRSTRSIGGG
jgi:hypothetical protein